MLNNESYSVINLTVKDMLYLNIFSLLLLPPSNYVRGLNFEKIIQAIITQIKAESYKFTDLNKKLVCFKKNSTTSLVETLTKDIIVIKTIVIILETIYEPSFSSRQFRSSLNHVNALKDVKLKLKDASWYIKLDISKCFNHIKLNVLMSILEEKIKDRRFTGLIWKALKAGHFNYFRNESFSGTKLENHGIKSLLYPIIVNIFLERFDIFIEKLASIDMKNISSVKLSYVRYEDHLILGIKGSYRDCVEKLNHIKIYFKQELFIELSSESVEILNAKLAKYVIFLGVRLCISRLQSNQGSIRLEAPINYIKGKLTKAGFLKDQKSVPKLIWTPHEKDIILFLYCSYYQNIINYYSFVSNRNKLDLWLKQVLNSSCLKLLASKFSLSSQKKVINRFGSNLINRSFYNITVSPLISEKQQWNKNPILFRAVIKRFHSNKTNINNGFNLHTYIAGFIDGCTKSLVVFGSNLSSTVGKKFTRTQLATVVLANHTGDIIVGLLLSDGWLTFSSKANKNARLGFAQSGAHSKYFWFVFLSLSHYCSSYPNVRIRTSFGKETISLEFFTRAMPCLTELYSLFYPNGIKIIPNDIFNMLTPIALAHIIMGDGSVSPHGLIICTDSYTIEDTIRLINVLIIKFSLECSLYIHKQNQYRIYIRQGSMASLLNIVSPFMHPSMLYKLKSALSISSPSNRNKIQVTDVKNNTTIFYDSISEAAKELNLPSHKTITNYIIQNQKKPYKGRYTFKKVKK